MNLAIPERRLMENAVRSVSLDDKRLMFSFARMTWKQGEAYCRKRSGRVASILDAETLSAVLEKMTELGMLLCRERNVRIYLLKLITNIGYLKY